MTNIKWYYPNPLFVDHENRVKISALMASEVPFETIASVDEQRRRLKDPRLYNYFLLLVERYEHEKITNKFEQLQKKFIAQSKELSQLKKSKEIMLL